MDIGELITRTEALDFVTLIKDHITEYPAGIITFQQKQMLHGETSDGEKIGRYKDQRYYAVRKYAQNPLAGFGFVDLRFKGPFQSAIKVTPGPSDVSMESTDEKNQKLTEQYGTVIYGLNETYAAQYSKTVIEIAVNLRAKKHLYGL